VADGQRTGNVYDANVADVVGRESQVGAQIEWIRGECVTSARSGRVQGVSIVERFGVGIDAAQSEAAMKRRFTPTCSAL
jgi:hypothetical protein